MDVVGFSIEKDIIEEEKTPFLWHLSAQLCQLSFMYQEPIRGDQIFLSVVFACEFTIRSIPHHNNKDTYRYFASQLFAQLLQLFFLFSLSHTFVNQIGDYLDFFQRVRHGSIIRMEVRCEF